MYDAGRFRTTPGRSLLWWIYSSVVFHVALVFLVCNTTFNYESLSCVVPVVVFLILTAYSQWNSNEFIITIGPLSGIPIKTQQKAKGRIIEVINV